CFSLRCCLLFPFFLPERLPPILYRQISITARRKFLMRRLVTLMNFFKKKFQRWRIIRVLWILYKQKIFLMLFFVSILSYRKLIFRIFYLRILIPSNARCVLETLVLRQNQVLNTN